MPKQSQSTTTATATKTQQKPAPTPVQGLATAPEQTVLLDFTGMTSLQNNAQRLGNPNLPRIQRQMMADKIGQQRGNSHMGQMMAFVRQSQLSAPAQRHQSQASVAPEAVKTRVSTRDAAHANFADTTSPSLTDASLAPSNATVDSGQVQLQQDRVTPTIQNTKHQQNVQIIQRDILDVVPDSLRRQAADFARNVPGYTLLAVALGRDPIAGTDVERSPTNLIRGVIGMIPGGELIFRNLEESGAIQSAFDWVQEQIANLGLTWPTVQSLLSRAVKRLSLTDVADPWGAFNTKIKPLFMPLFRKIKRFVLAAGEKLLEFIFEGAIKLAGPGAEQVLGILKRAGGAIKSIIKDPIRFLGNLIRGVRLGFNNFKEHIGAHLKQGFISWLTGSIAKAGIQLPKRWDLPGIFQLAMQVLGVSFSQLMGRVNGLLGIDVMGVIEPVQQLIAVYQEEGLAGLAKMGLSRIIGEERMASLMNVLNIFETLRNGKIGQLWQMLQGYLGNIKAMIFGKIREYVTESVITQGVTWLIGLFNPAGAIAKACSTIYDIIMFFVREGRRILPLVESVTDSIATLAAGNLNAAANAIENSLGRTIPLAIGFLASLLKLGDLPGKIRSFIEGVRGTVNNALDKLFNSKPVQTVAGFLKNIIGKVRGFVQGGVAKVKGLAAAGVGKAKQFVAGGIGKVKGWAATGVGKVKKKLGFGEKQGEIEPNLTSTDEKVKELARQRLALVTQKPFENKTALNSTVKRVEALLRPLGLNSLRLRDKQGNPGSYNIIARAEAKDVGDAYVSNELSGREELDMSSLSDPSWEGYAESAQDSELEGLPHMKRKRFGRAGEDDKMRTRRSDKKRKELFERFGMQEGDFQKHHIISMEELQDPALRVMFQFLRKQYGWNINGRSNVIYLPERSDVPGAGTRSIHHGSHAIYTSMIEGRLLQINQEWRVGNLSNDEMHQSVLQVQREYRGRLKRGGLVLNRADPRFPKKAMRVINAEYRARMKEAIRKSQ